ncbi:ROK family protein [Streptomyces sp. NPDC005438]|uniref:ROK family protein n=1 Tax=Streptomyces sp. NPDC005438 TaxID=3156880 RepID=UPI0033B6900D
MGNDLVAALDIGGTKIAGALIAEDGTLQASVLRPTPRSGDPQVVGQALAEVVGELRVDDQWRQVAAVGIGCAGPVDAKSGTVSPVNIGAWRDFPLVRAVSEAVGEGLPVTLVGDGVAMAAAEHWRGAARGYRNALGMVVSTGVGGGLVLDDRPYGGPTGNAGHIGHISVDLDGDLCACGGRGCVERLASGPNIARRAYEWGWRPSPGAGRTAADVARDAARGDQLAQASFDRAAQALAAGVAATAALVEVQVVVVGGGVSEAGETLFDPLRRALKQYVTLSFMRDLRVVPAQLGAEAGLVGAAAAARWGRG